MGTSGSTRLAIGYRVHRGAGPVGRVRGHGPGPTRPIRQPIDYYTVNTGYNELKIQPEQFVIKRGSL